LSDPKTPTTTHTTQEFCKVDNKTVADLETTETGVTWYDAEKGGNVVAPTTVLTDGTTYYGSLKVGICDSPTRLAVKVILSDPQTPTGATTQEFCRVDNKTVADLVTTESGVTWYDSADGTTVVPLTAVLENNKVYYGSLKVGTCESPARLAVTVTLSDPKTPTTAHTTQEFCKADNNTVADLKTTEAGVTWYDSATGIKALASTALLENNKTYYGSLKVGACESPIRLAVQVVIKSNDATPAPDWSAKACVFDEITYKTVSGMSDYNWLITSEGDIIAGGQPTDDYVTVVWNSVGKAVIKVDYIDISKCDPIVSVNFPVTVDSCSDIGLKMMVDNATPGIGQQVVFTLTAENLGISNSKEVVIENMLPSGYQYVDSNVSKGNYDHTNRLWSMPLLKAGESQTLKVIVKVKGRGDYLNIAYLKASNPEDLNETNNRAQASVRTKDVVVYNALSTNEDGINDYFRIEGLDQYPNNTVEIFNAGGVQIFNTNNYGSNNNVFRGISEGRATINKKTGVPTGTYYYILRYEAEGTMMEKAGYLYVSN
ncbi:gliding motility-associated C-terminal domain-containing protein, partial [Flavobacterium sp. ENC]|uniref:T9SS type B sorting domain-containing protein n=1 Tax=Flavobacterium sp. ENC TaxID=2897330 RepID=UPI001E64E9F2